ncbi:MAG: hypothetical protein IPN15_12650 [Saprospiraceae bacterium]|nr:hypothetical protein [Candidatus Vicinibacter affinis]
MDSYSKYSGLVTDIFADRAPIFEKASIDEFYRPHRHGRLFGCMKWSDELRQSIIRESGLPISFGLSQQKNSCPKSAPGSQTQRNPRDPFGTERTSSLLFPTAKIPASVKLFYKNSASWACGPSKVPQ